MGALYYQLCLELNTVVWTLWQVYLGYVDPQLNDPLLDHPDEGGQGVAAGHGGRHRNVSVLHQYKK